MGLPYRLGSRLCLPFPHKLRRWLKLLFQRRIIIFLGFLMLLFKAFQKRSSSPAFVPAVLFNSSCSHQGGIYMAKARGVLCLLLAGSAAALGLLSLAALLSMAPSGFPPSLLAIVFQPSLLALPVFPVTGPWYSMSLLCSPSLDSRGRSLSFPSCPYADYFQVYIPIQTLPPAPDFLFLAANVAPPCGCLKDTASSTGPKSASDPSLQA